MDWDQIESKWAAMTRRVRSDVSLNKPDATRSTPCLGAMADATASIDADLPDNESAAANTTMSAQ